MARVLTFRFDTFGDVTTASSRLRAWKLREFLAASGHRVSMNEGEPCDVYVCQKVRPFATLRALQEAGALVVYDFDDHLLLEGAESHGVKEEVVAFINAADVVTVGSEYLAEAARNFHRNVFVLENPVDIGSTELVREKTAELKRIGWFGTSAGLVDLRAIKTAERVETITRGGDIEFDLKSIDRTLTGFDLLLLPVEISDGTSPRTRTGWSRRWRLGSRCSPHRRPRISPPRSAWSRRTLPGGRRRDLGRQDRRSPPGFRLRSECGLARAGQRQRVVLDAPNRRRLAAADRARARGESHWGDASLWSDEALEDVALVTLAYRAAKQPASAEPDGISFGSRHAVAPARPAIISRCSTRCGRRSQRSSRSGCCSSRKAFAQRQALPASCAARLQNEPHCHVFVVRSQEPGFPADEWAAYSKDLRGTLCHPRDPGTVLARRSWLMRQPWRPADCLSYWTWVLLVQALSEGVAGVVAAPVVLRDKAPAITISAPNTRAGRSARAGRQVGVALSRHAMAPPEHRRACIGCGAIACASGGGVRLHGERSDCCGQWRMSPRAPMSLGRLEQELRSVYASSSWRLTSPLRAAAQVARRIGARSRAARE